jgi:hypothetical protein
MTRSVNSLLPCVKVISMQMILVDLPPVQRFMKLDLIDWNRAFFKTYSEKRSSAHLLINFNQIWVRCDAYITALTPYHSEKVRFFKHYSSGKWLPMFTRNITALTRMGEFRQGYQDPRGRVRHVQQR